MISASPSDPLVRYRDVSPLPWANGAGTTSELVSFDDSLRLGWGDARWRLSIASLERCAPFSPLPGVQRQFMPVGANVVLVVDGHRTPVAEGTVCAFSGDAEVELVELPSRCNAVNVMVATSSATQVALPADGTRDDRAYSLGLRSVVPDSSAPRGAAGAVVLRADSEYDRFDLIHSSSAFPQGTARTLLAVLVVDG